MKIGIVLRRFHTRGGTERRTCELVRGLLDANHEIHLFAEEWDKELTDGIVCHRIYTIKAARWIKALSFAIFSSRATRRQNLDLVHSQARTFTGDVATLGGGCHADYLIRSMAGASAMRRAWEFNHPFHRATIAIERMQYRNSSRIILNSELAMHGLLRYFPWAKDKCRVIHNGVDPEFFQPSEELRIAVRHELGVSPKALVFLFVGSGFERKGLAEFLRGLALAIEDNADRDTIALVVGRGNIPKYQALSESLGIGKRVLFTGAVGNTRGCYCAADVFVLPTYFDPYANTTNEALASGLPVITTRTNGAYEILSSNEGFVIEKTQNIEELAAAMIELLDDRRRKEMAENARLLAQQHPWRDTTKKTLAIYEEILAGRRERL